MALISSSIPNLINGVSQQPPALRLSSQAEVQENGYGTVVDGLRKRPPSVLKAIISGWTGRDPIFSHIINRDKSERYVILIRNGDLKVFDLAGNEKKVWFPFGNQYLYAPNSATDFSILTVADYTFIVNKSVTVQKHVDELPVRAQEAIVWIRQAGYGVAYEITMDGSVTLKHETPAGTTAADAVFLKTTYIAEQLAEKIRALGPEWYAQTRGSIIHTFRHDTKPFTLAVSDGLGDQAMVCIKDSVQRFTDLPKNGIKGFRVRVKGDQNSKLDDYFVEYVTEGRSEYGVWKESYKGGEQYHMADESMPHVLIRNSDGTFTFTAKVWGARGVGEVDTVPWPSFVGKKISDIFFYRNRLGFLSDENVSLSKASDFFTFWRETMTAVLDTDPIDASVSHTRVSLLKHAVTFHENLLLFSDMTQFTLGRADLLTPKTISINATTEFGSSPLVKPVGAGKNVYFVTPKGDHSAIREYFLDGNTKTNDAVDITAHVPQYLPGNIIKLASSSNEDIVVCLSQDMPSSLFVYKYYWAGQEKLQSSWSKWIFNGSEIMNIDFIESDLVLILKRGNRILIETINIETGKVDPGRHYTIHLDHRIDDIIEFTKNKPMTYDPATDLTSLFIPYNNTAPEINAIALEDISGTPYRTGNNLKIIRGAMNGVFIKGDVRSGQFCIGQKYTFRYKFSPFALKEEAVGGGLLSIDNGRIQLRNITLKYANSGFFKVTVQPTNKNTYTYIFERTVGNLAALLGDMSLETGRFRFPVLEKNDMVSIEIINDTFMPCSFLSADWEADYTIRSQRMR